MCSPLVPQVSPAGQQGPRGLVDLHRAHTAQAPGLFSAQEVVNLGPRGFTQAPEMLAAARPESRGSRAGDRRPGQAGEGAAWLELWSEGCVQILKHAMVH